MGASPLMSIGVRAMNASYAALNATGHNIANASVDGYSRQQAELSTAQGQFTGSGFVGRGVDVTTVTRSHNEFLTREAAASRSLSALDATRSTQLQRLQSVFRLGEQGLGHATGQFLNAFADLSSNPGDSATRQVVLSRADDMASRFRAAGEQLDALQDGVRSDLRAALGEVNALAQSIATINGGIASQRGLGQPANDLLDERDRLLARLSDHVQVSRVEAGDGTMSVFIAGGQRLVLGTEASTLEMLPDSADPRRVAVGVKDGLLERRIDENALGGGGIAGLLHFQNVDLVAGGKLVGEMATGIADAVNNQHQLGLNLRQPPSTGAKFFDIGQPVERAAHGMRSLLTDPRDLAAASAHAATTGSENTGTATVASLTSNATPLPVPGARAEISFTDDAGSYDWQLLDASNTVLSSGSGVMSAGQPIPTPPADINGFTLQLAGVPRSGDTVTVNPSENGNALALLALRDAPLAGGATPTDTWAQALADIGVRVQSASTGASISAAVAAETEAQRSGQAGVNLDEEAARLIQYQQSYQAAAKVLQVAQVLFDTLLEVTR